MIKKHQHTAGDRTPYTYLVRCFKTNRVYYGVRYGKNCHPTELGIKYFSSSTTIKRLIESYGLECIKFEVRKTFNTIQKAKDWETKILKHFDAANNPFFINRHNNNNIFPVDNTGTKNPAFGLPGTMLGKKHKPETIEKMRLSKSGENSSFLGRHHTEQSKQKARDKQLGAKSSKFKGYYHTPHGKFESSRLGSTKELNHKLILKYCKNNELVITKNIIWTSSYLKPEHLGKTFKDLGFWYESVN